MTGQKMEIKRIENNKARHVCFSKRQASIFNKANELSILCGAMITVVVFSPSGKAFSFGHPSVNYVANRFLTDNAPNNPIVSRTSQDEDGTQANVRKLAQQQSKLKRQLKAAMSRKKLLEEEIARESGGEVMNRLLSGRDELGLEDLQEFHKELTAIHVMINERKQMLQDMA